MKEAFQNSFYRKLQISFIFLIIIPVLLLSVYTYTLYKNIVLEKVELSNETVVNVLKNDIEKTIRDMILASQIIVADHQIKDALVELKGKDRIYDFDDLKNHEKIKERFSHTEMRTLTRDINMFLATKDALIIPSIRISDSVHTLSEHWTILKERVSPDEKLRLQLLGRIPEENNEERHALYFARLIETIDSDNYLGYLNIIINDEYFANLFSEVDTANIALYDDQNNLIYDNEKLPDIDLKDAMREEVVLSQFNWKLVYTSPKSQLTEELTNKFLKSLVVISLLVIFFLLLSLLLARKIYRPINKLQKVTKEYRKGNRAVRFKEHGDDEIINLGRSINDMFDEIEILIFNIGKQNQKQKELEINALFSQIRPHFLMNTLNSIRCSLDLEQDVYHSNKILSLMLLMRKYLKVNEPSTLKNECEFLSHYIDIMMMRNDIDINLEIDLPEKFASTEFPFLSLQPIVENSIIHGFYQQSEGIIIVHIFEKNEQLMIQVTDDGIGMTVEKCQNINQAQKTHALDQLTEDDPVGLINIYQRLQLIYGEQAKLFIESEEGFGTTVTIQVPINRLGR